MENQTRPDETLFQHLSNSPRTIFHAREIQQLSDFGSETIRLNNIKIDEESAQGVILSSLGINCYKFNFIHKKPIIYYKKGFSIEELAASLTSRGYFSNIFAAYIHGITTSHSRVIINEEQWRANNLSGKITQRGIDSAFQNPQRKSSNTCFFREYVITFTNSANTNKLGVINIDYQYFKFNTTDIDRTLIDLAVRPSYAGGYVEVYLCYKNAIEKNLVDPQRLLHYLKKMNFSFPYVQAIGFYLYIASGKKEIYSIFETEPPFNFYCDYQIDSPTLSKKWKVYYPQSLQTLVGFNIE